MENKDKIFNDLRNETERLPIPDSIEPENMRKKIISHLEEKMQSDAECEKVQGTVEKFAKKRFSMWKPLAAVACICIAVGAVWGTGLLEEKNAKSNEEAAVKKDTAAEIQADEPEILKIADAAVTYEQIYTSMEKVWNENEAMYRSDVILEGAVNDLAFNKKESLLIGETNVQTKGVDEGDIIKNDGRYLYQKIYREENGTMDSLIQILDTKDGLKESSVIGGLENVEEFYVWKDLLIAIQRKYLEEDYAMNLSKASCDLLYNSNEYHEIVVFDIADRSNPEILKTFHLQGSYASSRITDGYFYGFSRYYANPGTGADDLDSYVPSLDGIRIKEECMVLPEESTGTSYLVLVSVDLNNPTEFVQTAGIVTDSEQFYVSADNIYVTSYKGSDHQTGTATNKTNLMRFSYGEGKFRMEAEGEVPGSLNDTFALDEYQDYLRVVSTVWEYENEVVVDDRTGEEIGVDMIDSRQTNALYVLDQNLKIVGKIEGLAEDEMIYSARFMGDTGYFVTFRQMDPLFAVDLSDPNDPKILDELKISGFSEYLHFYSEDRLLGLGMEADEETGQTEGMKLSMFDISDPTELKEISKESLEEYYYSEALYDHRMMMISPVANLFGFAVEGSTEKGYVRDYLVYSYAEDTFVQRLKVNVNFDDYGSYTARGTFIGDQFYLLCGNGTAEQYDLNTGELVKRLEP